MTKINLCTSRYIYFGLGYVNVNIPHEGSYYYYIFRRMMPSSGGTFNCVNTIWERGLKTCVKFTSNEQWQERKGWGIGTQDDQQTQKC